jgi:hypothetical protein
MGHASHGYAADDVELYRRTSDNFPKTLDDAVPLGRVEGQSAVVDVDWGYDTRLKRDGRVWREPDCPYFQQGLCDLSL